MSSSAKVRMKTMSAGPAGNRIIGEVCVVAPEEGAELVRGGYAEWVESPKAEKPVEVAVKPEPPARDADVEVAVLPEPENAALRTKPPAKKPRKRKG